MNQPPLSVDFLRSILRYEPETGLFFWRGHGRKPEGTLAGTLMHDGYIRIGVGKVQYPAHHLAWAYMTGAFPDGRLDHKDRKRSHNAFANLRKASPSQNAANRSLSTRNTSGVKGVTWNKQCNKWQVMIGKAYVGVFADLAEASAAYSAVAAARYGEFAS